MKHALADHSHLDPGEIGTVAVSFWGDGNRKNGDVLLDVFKTATDAKRSYDKAAQEIAANVPQSMSIPASGGLCYGDQVNVGACRSVIGRTTVFLIFRPIVPRDDAMTAMKTIIDYVSSRQRD